MPLVTLTEALAVAEKRKIAIGGFNIGNYESLRSVIDCAAEYDLPVIIQIYNRLFNDIKAKDMSALVRAMAADQQIPVVLHLDHGKTVEQVKKALSYGFTSVMIDGSELPKDENIKLTKEVVAMAHARGVSVEAEIGRLLPKGTENLESHLTVPEEALEFVSSTSVDALAVAIGTSHGFYRETPFIDHERLKAIHALVKVPLVLHGGSCTPDEDVRKSILYGIRKINIATEFHQAFIDGVISQTEIHKTKFSPIDVFMTPVYDKMKELVKQKITFFAGLQ